jgi:hypothetical protein
MSPSFPFPGRASLLCLILVAALASPTFARPNTRGGAVPAVPPVLQVPAGVAPFLIAHAIGTQNYVCLPTSGVPAWLFIGPQATLYHNVNGQMQQQITTHFLSANPDESRLARPTWQHSIDSGRVWGRALQSSIDPAFVAPGAIPWLLVGVAGSEAGPIGGAYLTQAVFIHRVNTSGGMAPATGCSASTIGNVALVPYEADYVFYRYR